MKKLYVVNFCDKEDGGHLLAQAMFEQAKDARAEFVRVRNLIFEGYTYDMPDEFGFRCDNHFTRYNTYDYCLSLEIIKINEKMNHYLFEQPTTGKYYLPLYSTEEYNPTIGSVFDTAVNEASSCWHYNKGFKCIYGYVSRCLVNSFVSCSYINKKGEQRMKYRVRPKEGDKDITVVVCKEDEKYKYTWHYE